MRVAAGQPPGPSATELGAAIRADRRRELLRIGSNLNQAVHALNTIAAAGPDASPVVRAMATDFDIIIAETRVELRELLQVLAEQAAR